MNPPKNRCIDQEFSPSELWDHVEKEPIGRDPDGWSSSKAAEAWNGNISWKKAKDYARNGWPEGTDKIAPTLARVDELIAHVMPEPRMSYDVVGDAPDVGAYLAGIPENMLTTEIQEGAARMVRVCVNVGASAGVSPRAIEARGIIACALTDALERAGYRVEVRAGWSQRTRDPKPNAEGALYLGTWTTLKRAEEPLSLDRITFALIHPSFMRRILFRVMELIPDRQDRDAFTDNAYGCPCAVVGAAGDIIVTEMYGHGNDWTPEILAAEVGRYLKEVGVHEVGVHMDGVGIEA